MRIYLFDPGNGVYEGETFDENGIINNEEGITTIAPPEYEHGQVPIFNRCKEEWTVLPVTEIRQLLHVDAATAEKKS